MKIVLVGPVTPYTGGIAKFNETLGDELVRSGHEVQFLSFEQLYPRAFYPGTGPTAIQAGQSRADTAYLLSWHMIGGGNKIKKWLREYQPDLILLHWWVPVHFWTFFRLFRILDNIGIPARVIVHNALPHEPFPLAPQLSRLALKSAQGYVVMAEGEALKTQTLLGSRTPVCLTPHPLMPPFPAQNGSSLGNLQVKYGVPQDASVLLFLGYVRPYKGLKELLTALASLIDQGKDLYLIVAGEFWDDIKEYEAQIGALRLEKHVRLIPRFMEDAEIAELFSLADLFVVPYLRGTQSGVLKLALGNGLPCVVSSSVADPYVQSRSDCCVVYSAGSQIGLQEVIISGMKLEKRNAEENQVAFAESWQEFVRVLINCDKAGTE